MLEITKGIESDELTDNAFAIRFVSEGGQFEQLIEDEGFPLKRMESRLSKDKLDYIIAINDEEKLGVTYSTQEIIAKVEADMAYLRQVRPAAVITASYLSMPVACQVADVPLVWTIQSTWLRDNFA